MRPRFTNKSLSRRDFLKLILTSSSAAIIAPLLKPCKSAPSATATPSSTVTSTILPPTPTATGTPDPVAQLLAGLEGSPIDTFFDESLKHLLLHDPEGMTINGDADHYGVRQDQLNNFPDEYVRQTQALVSGILDLLRGYDRAALTPDQALSADIYGWDLDDRVRGHPYMYRYNPIMPLSYVYGENYRIYQLFTDVHPLEDLQDAQDYISRLVQVNGLYEQILGGLRRQEELGIIIPCKVIPGILIALNEIARGNPHSTPFYTAFADKMNAMASLGSTEKSDLLEQVETITNESVIPAYQALSDYFEHLRPIAPLEIGVLQFPNGQEYYARLLRHYTTTELTADEIHNLGLQHIERIQGEMREVYDQLAYPAGKDLTSLWVRMVADCRMVTGDEYVKAVEDAFVEARRMLGQAFDLMPQAQVIVVGGELGNFLMPVPLDNSHPAVLYVASDMLNQPYFKPRNLVFHEANPGHHFQITIAREFNTPYARRTMQIVAFEEGWGFVFRAPDVEAGNPRGRSAWQPWPSGPRTATRGAAGGGYWYPCQRMVL